ncbi:phosphoenolpyruvate--protein phosphotransferase [Afifella sp. JA880]|uniref:phosphoenolpyruvate--protein phosphotransferase n=1 Tax=Afifella sp. JA880 TaxID=2975280 RepID=UPI0021BB10C1|nr:phosphoenolpyruvate--protein phosphotransferase [Afifella sp. JA880]MCT8267807.1 phosphoenolpyruvate--protein phosphotransferase [Afifella sp. JA880]
MIGIVVVSHSARLAEGVKELADGMTQVEIPIAAAGGVDDPDNPLGTDGIRVLEAIHEVMSDEGVLIFADLGSAKLSADMAIDLLEPEEQEKVKFCDAPLVEGVLAAAVQIASGGKLADVMREAQEAGAVAAPEAGSEDTDAPAARDDSDTKAEEFVIRNRHGLHARPASLLVQTMNGFDGDIRLENLTKGKKPVNAKSINGIMLSAVTGNDRIRLTAAPDEADAVFSAMRRLVEDNFGEDDEMPAEAPAPSKPAPSKAQAASSPGTSEAPEATDTLTGITIAPGFALGPLHHVRQEMPKIEAAKIDDPDAEIARFDEALKDAEAEIEAAMQAMGEGLSDYDRQIFSAHITYLHDPEITGGVRERIRSEKLGAAAIWQETMSELADTYSGLEDKLLQGRAADIVDVGQRVLRFLIGDEAASALPDEPAILAFHELRPSDVLRLADTSVLGICSAVGGETSHAGILASNLSIPVVFSLGEGLNGVKDGQKVLLDGGKARLDLAPDPDDIARMERDRAAFEALRAEAEAAKDLAAETKDGHLVRAAANMASLEELATVADSGAEEIGLMRTEFLFMDRDAAPDEDEQTEIYKRIIAGLKGRPLTVRTMDIGGDKPVAYMDRPAEENPNLGWRGLRYSLDETALFDTQLAAILRASTEGPVRIMFPMVSTLEELRAAKDRLQAVKDRLGEAGQPFDDKLEIGIMIEVPAAAEMADRLAPEVDFFSIGTNDLTQYMMAADRANPKVQKLSDPLQPAVLRMVARAIAAAHEAGIWIGMCGAMAGNRLAASVLLGLGLDEFSMKPVDIGTFKLTVRRLAKPACEDLAAEVLKLDGAEAVRKRVAAFLDEIETD